MNTEIPVLSGIAAENPDREIGRYGGYKKGPNLIFFGGIHGNEPTGIIALRKVLETLESEKPDFRGTFVGIAGNRAALQNGVRYVVRDLNRIWFPGSLVDPEKRKLTPEYGEKIEILEKILEIIGNREHTYLFDLHSTSSQSVPFISISDTLKNRELVEGIPVTLVLGLEELLDGPMFSFFSEMGIPAVLFEGGQNEALSTLENHMAFIWLMLQKLGCLRREFFARLSSQEEVLRKNNPGGQGIFEIKYRHLLKAGGTFRMMPGYVNFQPVVKGELLARDTLGDIRSPRSGSIFMPLYQKLGLEGFFIVRRISPFWYRLSRRARKWGVDKRLNLFPGVYRASQRPDTIVIDRRIARWRVVSLFHLLGYRKLVDEGRYVTLSRRPFDANHPNMRQVTENLRQYIEILRKDF